MTQRTALLLLAACAAACKTDAAPPAGTQKTSEPASQLAGVWPNMFRCDSIVTTAALSQLLGGEVKPLDNPTTVPKGIAPPCVYEIVKDGNAIDQWQFDFDCRENMKSTANALFEQYRTQNTDMINEWNAKADAGAFKANDAGIEYNRPGDPVEVAVGAKGLDHHGQALIFIDDDAPCYVRVAGRDATRRVELAKLLAKNLTFQNAPMTPRPKP